MSNLNSQPVVYDVMPEGYPNANAEANAPETQTTPKKKKNWGARLFAIVLIALCAVPVLLPVQIVKGASVTGLSFLTAVKELFTGNYQKLLGVLPTYADVTTTTGLIVGCVFYVTLATLALSALIALVTVFCSKKAPAMLRVATFFYTFGMTLHVISTILVALATSDVLVIDIIALGLLGAGLLIYLVLAVAKNGKTAWANTFMMLLTAVVAGALSFIVLVNKAVFYKGLDAISFGKFAWMVALGILALSTLSLFVAIIRMQTKKGLGLNLAIYIVNFIVGVAVCYLVIASKEKNMLALILAIVSAVVSLLQAIICILRKKAVKKANATETDNEETEQAPAVAKKTRAEKKAEKQAKKDAKKALKEEKKMAKKNKKAKVMEAPAPVVQPVAQEFVREEYAEALPYEGGPVEGVAVAEEVNPTFIPSSEPPQVQTAGYDFYNCKSFDPFIATLDGTQRNQFTEIFILKYSGTMPEIPDYEVGGDNKEFFRKLFIYLGQYRDRIPDGLLSKIYQFAVKLS